MLKTLRKRQLQGFKYNYILANAELWSKHYRGFANQWSFMCTDCIAHCQVSHRGSDLCRINGEQVCDDNLLVAWLPGNVATWLQHNGAGGKRTPLRLRSILSRDGVSGARGYCHVVLKPMDFVAKSDLRRYQESAGL